MTEEQSAFLARRLEDAAKSQPELKAIRDLLLTFGGIEFVPPSKPDPDVPALLSAGQLMIGSVVNQELDPGYCHENVSELWLDKTTGVTALGVGYALSEDGLWRQHSWALKGEELVETTAKRVKYFGLILNGAAADGFAQANQGDPEDGRWRRLPDIWFHRERDEDGYPPKEWEGLKSEPTANAYRIKSIPFFARGVAYDDLLTATKADDGDYLVFKDVVSHSGYSAIRLWLGEDESVEEVTKSLTDRRCLIESAPNFGHRLIAVAIPPAEFQETYLYIARGKDDGRWDTEDGHIGCSSEQVSDETD